LHVQSDFLFFVILNWSTIPHDKRHVLKQNS